ncbi:uncharacterized protein RCC_04098 [Ramularia collo-cygni]|uniref:Myb-like domain-containing protein n=1 Tax=Ramularia collo-cygni TaxID=112498 RepID=A0A2D3VCL0_9PEZI|nr:uncharacterized protein RCC_04098 [Ramularia collo-cygni]CZT18253.1 uncharacterized protein RCC_04098 [Ramularia collo-cygni]
MVLCGISSNAMPRFRLNNCWNGPKEWTARWSRTFHPSLSIQLRQLHRWSQEENELIIKMRGDGAPVREISACLPHRTFHATGIQIGKLMARSPELIQRTPQPGKQLDDADYHRITEAKENKHRPSWKHIQETYFPHIPIMTLTRNWHRHRNSRVASPSSSSGAPWTLSEDEQLLRLREAPRVPWTAVMRALPGRSEYSLVGRYRKLRTSITTSPSVPKIGAWTEAETAKVLRLTAHGVQNSDIARAVGRTMPAVVQQKHLLRTSKISAARDLANESRARRLWTSEELERAVTLQASGHDSMHIAQQLNRTWASVEYRLFYMEPSEKALMLENARLRVENEKKEKKVEDVTEEPKLKSRE